MIARADFDDRESLIRLLERRAGEDFARLGCTESEDAVLEDEPDDDEFFGGLDAGELAEEAVAAGDDATDTRDNSDPGDVEATEECEWTPPPLTDVSDSQDDDAEAASAPEFDADAHYAWMDRLFVVPEDGLGATAGDASKVAGQAGEQLPADPIERLQVLVTAAKYGDDNAIIQIRKCLDKHPEIWQRVGDLAAHAESLLIEIIADGNAMVVESMEREVRRLKTELSEGEPGPLERLTIQRIVACWLNCQYVDRATLAADAAGSRATAWGKRQEAAERRYQLAIKSLDMVRRLRPRATLRAEPKPAETTLPATATRTAKAAPPQSPLTKPAKTTSPETTPSPDPQVRFSPENRIRQYETQKVVETT
jgi:hypothetical protein